MLTITHFFYGLIAIGIGTLFLKYNYQVVGFTGRQDWIESKLGGGSTFFAYKMFALLLIIGGLLAATGLGDPVASALLSPFKGIFAGFAPPK